MLNIRGVLLFYGCKPKVIIWTIFFSVINPAIYVSSTSLNKEIWSIYFATSYIFYFVTKNKKLYFLNLIASLFIRDAIFLVGLIYYFLPKSKKYLMYLLYVASIIVVPILMLKITSISFTGATLQSRSANFFEIFMKIESIPFGYVLTLPFKVMIQFFAGTLSHHYLEWSSKSPYHIALTISSLLFLVISTIICMKATIKRIWFNPYIYTFIVVYVIIFCMIPYSVHRQFIPLFIPLVLLFTTSKFVKS